MRQVHFEKQTKKKKNRTTVMRKVKRMLSDEDFLPVTRLQLDRRIKCDVCEALIVPTSYKRHKKAIHNDNSLEKQ